MHEVFKGQRELFYAVVGKKAIVMEGWYLDEQGLVNKPELAAAIIAVKKLTGLAVKVVRGTLRACSACSNYHCPVRNALG